MACPKTHRSAGLRAGRCGRPSRDGDGRRRPPRARRACTPSGTSATRFARSMAASTGERPARLRSAWRTASSRPGPASATPPPSTITSGSTVCASSATAPARWPATSSSTATAPGSPPAAAASSADVADSVAVAGGPPGGDGGARGQHLEAAPLPAIAQRPLGIDRQMPDLAGGACAPGGTAVEHQAGGEAGADAQVGEVAPAPEGRLRPRRRPGSRRCPRRRARARDRRCSPRAQACRRGPG